MKEIAPEQDIRADFITKLDRPPSLHNGRMLVLDATGAYNPDNPSLPKAFGVTVELDKLDTAMLETDKLSNIALGDHSFGAKFTEKPGEQFVVCCIAETAEQRDFLTKAVQDSLADKPWAKRVKVEGIAKGK